MDIPSYCKQLCWYHKKAIRYIPLDDSKMLPPSIRGDSKASYLLSLCGKESCHAEQPREGDFVLKNAGFPAPCKSLRTTKSYGSCYSSSDKSSGCTDLVGTTEFSDDV